MSRLSYVVYELFIIHCLINLICSTNDCESFLSSKRLGLSKLFKDSINPTDLDSLDNKCRGELIKNRYYLNVQKLVDIPEEGLNITFSSTSFIQLPKTCYDNIKDKYELGSSAYIVAIEYHQNKLFYEDNYMNRIKFLFFDEQGEIKFRNSDELSVCSDDPITVNYAIDIKGEQQDKYIFSEELMTEEEKKEYIDNEKVIINMTKVLYAKNEYDIDLFNQTDEFFRSVCVKFKTKAGADVPLNRRISDYKVNISTCNLYGNESVYTGFKYELNEEGKLDKLYISCAFGYFGNEEEKNTYLETVNSIDEKLNKVFKNSNFKVVECTSDVFALNIDNILKNYGEIICSGVLILQGILLLSYLCIGTTPIKNEVEKFLKEAEQIEANGGNLPANAPLPEYAFESHKSAYIKNNNVPFTSEVIYNNQRKSAYLPQTMNRLSINTTNRNIVNDLSPSNSNLSQEKNTKKMMNKRSSLNPSFFSNPPKYQSKTSTSILLSHPPRRSSSKDVLNLAVNRRRSRASRQSKANEFSGGVGFQTAEEVNSSGHGGNSEASIEINEFHDLNDVELNALSLHNARKYDERNCCCMYWSFLKLSQLIIFTFCNRNDYNLTIVKISLLIFVIPMQLTFNSFFYSDEDISAIYIDKENLTYSFNISNLPRALASSVIGYIILFILKKLCLSHSGIEEIRKEKSIEKAKSLTDDFMCSLKCQIFVYFIVSSALLMAFWFFVSAFCYVFEGLQIILIKDTLLSFAFTLFYPFLISMGAAICRRCGICCNCGCWYCISKILSIF